MTSGPTDWHQALARVNGQLVHGEQRVTTHELLTVHLGVPVTDPACRRLRRVMRDLGWRGPRLMRWGRKTPANCSPKSERRKGIRLSHKRRFADASTMLPPGRARP
jgi:hypothetical protein